ncbi:MAG TPA: hypothetical protein IAC15_07405 [Candidatus Onthomonas avicola]|nr:hypothetical protein [Candidatus Onthomonas avicola]
MVKVIMEPKGSGKTKQLIEMINSAVLTEHGNVVCIEWDRELVYDIHYHIRLIEASDFYLPTFEALKGFISGLYAGNYDITHIFVDNLSKVVPCKDLAQIEDFLDWMDRFSTANGLKFTVTISADAESMTDGIKKYLNN